MNNVYIGLGSNLGDRLSYLLDAQKEISKGSKIIQCSSVYETAPIGFTDQNTFYNMVIQIETSFFPDQLLIELLSIEQKLNRIRNVKWGPRTIDLDILIYNDLILNTDSLSLPHPGIKTRRFVLEPLIEIAPFLHLPGDSYPLSTYLVTVQDQKIEKLNFTQKNIVLSS